MIGRSWPEQIHSDELRHPRCREIEAAREALLENLDLDQLT